jgi:hypothetical protein
MAAVEPARFYPCLAAPKGLQMFYIRSGFDFQTLKYTNFI